MAARRCAQISAWRRSFDAMRLNVAARLCVLFDFGELVVQVDRVAFELEVGEAALALVRGHLQRGSGHAQRVAMDLSSRLPAHGSSIPGRTT